MKEFDSWMHHYLGRGCRYAKSWCNLYLGSAKVCSPAIFETYFSYQKNIWIVVTVYYVYFYLIVLFPLPAILQLINFTPPFYCLVLILYLHVFPLFKHYLDLYITDTVCSESLLMFELFYFFCISWCRKLFPWLQGKGIYNVICVCSVGFFFGVFLYLNCTKCT